nr:uncharacterized protein LOC125422645 [Ziziphus jujuba var. spinosa]
MIVGAQQSGMGVQIPSPYEIKEKYLDIEYKEMQQHIEKFKESWKTYGCTIMCDGWTGPTKLSILNFMVYYKGSSVFLKSVDASDKIKNYKYIYKLLENVINEVGKNNVVQVVTDNGSAFVKADICKGDIVRPGAIRFATNYIALNSLLKKKASLKQVFTSDAWAEHQLNRTKGGKEVEKLILDNHFWDSVTHIVNLYGPLYTILRIVDAEFIPTMPILYDCFQKMRYAINNQRGIQWVMGIINARWDNKLSHPLHMAAYFLNPRFQYKEGIGTDSDLVQAVHDVFAELYPNSDRISQFGNEIICFRDARKGFGDRAAIAAGQK